jgi:hypothetical protein
MKAPMANPDPNLLLIKRAFQVSAESRALLDRTDHLLGTSARLLEERIHLLREIVNASRDVCDAGALAVAELG